MNLNGVASMIVSEPEYASIIASMPSRITHPPSLQCPHPLQWSMSSQWKSTASSNLSVKSEQTDDVIPPGEPPQRMRTVIASKSGVVLL